MDAVQKATETQIKNIQSKTGKSLQELEQLAHASGLSKHGELRDYFKRELGLGHGDANTLVHTLRAMPDEGTAPGAASTDDVLDTIYAGPKAALRPIHDKLMDAINDFGDFQIAPKKNYVSLRRKKQFAMIGPATQTRVEVGLNTKTLDATDRLAAMPAGGMCNFTVRITDPAEVDDELIGWVRTAYADAG